MTMTLSGSGTIAGLVAGGLPDATVTQPDLAAGVAGNGPAFRAVPASNQTLSSGTYTKITLGTENFDTDSNFASSTFTPTVAGYYQINGTLQGGATTSVTVVIASIYKNGSIYQSGSWAGIAGQSSGNSQISTVIYMNGTTDYLEFYGYISGSGTLTSQSLNTSFSGFLARAA